MTQNAGAHPNQSHDRKQVRPLLVDLSKRYGGASTRTVALATALQDWGAGIAALEDSPVAQAAREAGVPVVEIARHKWDPRISFRIAAACRNGYDLLDTQNIQSKVWGSLAATLSGAGLVSTLNSWYAAEHGGSVKGRVYVAVERLTGARTDLYIAVSNGIQKALCEAGFPAGAIQVIHNGIRPMPKQTDDPNAVRTSLGLPADALLCTAVGRLVWAKGYSDLIDAFAWTAPRVPNLYCVVVGEGELRAELEQRIVKAGWAQRFLLAGFRTNDEVMSILRTSDLFVMPSRSEGIPYALLEAGTLGLPIVASRCGGIPEVVTSGVDALLVEPGDIQRLAAAMESLCVDRERAKQLGQMAKLRIDRDFSLAAQAGATKAAYLRAVEHRHPRP